MANQLLISLVNSILGEGKNTARENIAYFCPLCPIPSSKPKLEICFAESKEGMNPYSCWKCGIKGKKLNTLFKKLKVSKEKVNELKKYVKIYDYSKPETIKEEQIQLELPKEYKSLIDNKDLIARHALVYLKNRGVNENDIIKYGIGYCEYGLYKNRIILPSFDKNGKLNYFTARSFEEEPFEPYKNPQVSRDIIPFELFINWDLPITIVEGFFDAIATKRNVIPLLGKVIQPNLMKKLVSSSVKKIYFALDKDALKQSLKYCEMLLNEGKEIYLVNLKQKDPSQIGMYGMVDLLQHTQPLTYKDLLEKKLETI